MIDLYDKLSAAELNAVSFLLGDRERDRQEDNIRREVRTDVSIPDLLRSETALQNGIFNQPDSNEVRQYLRDLAILLTTYERIYGELEILSGYRSPELNAHPDIRGSKKSVHMQGRAGDVRQPGTTLVTTGKRLLELGADKIILERLGHNGGWVHVEIPKKNRAPRGRVVTARKINGKIMYRAGFA